MISKSSSNLNLVRSYHLVATRGASSQEDTLMVGRVYRQEDTHMVGRVYLLLVLIHQAIRVWGIQDHTQQGPSDLV